MNDDTSSHVEKKRVSTSLMRGDPPLLSLYGKTDTLRRHTLSKRKLFFASQVRLPPTFFCRGQLKKKRQRRSDPVVLQKNRLWSVRAACFYESLFRGVVSLDFDL